MTQGAMPVPVHISQVAGRTPAPFSILGPGVGELYDKLVEERLPYVDVLEFDTRDMSVGIVER